MNILGRSDFTELRGDKYDSCVMCGSQKYRVVIRFDSGSAEPAVGETITGATSADTGVVEFIQLTGGAYTDGNAVGVMVLDEPTGYDQYNLSIFTDDENLNGPTPGAGANFATVNGITGVNKSGRMHPDSNLITYNGVKYCKEHFRFRFKKEWEDDAKIDISEGERGK